MGFLSLLLEKASPSVRIFLCSLFAAAARNITLVLSPISHYLHSSPPPDRRSKKKPLWNVLKESRKLCSLLLLPCKAERSVKSIFWTAILSFFFNLFLHLFFHPKHSIVNRICLSSVGWQEVSSNTQPGEQCFVSSYVRRRKERCCQKNPLSLSSNLPFFTPNAEAKSPLLRPPSLASKLCQLSSSLAALDSRRESPISARLFDIYGTI